MVIECYVALGSEYDGIVELDKRIERDGKITGKEDMRSQLGEEWIH